MDNPSTLLVVQDLDASKKFYVNELGLLLIEDNESSVKLKCGSHDVFMFQGTQAAIQYDHGYNSNSSLVFTVSNLDEKISELKSMGIFFIHESPNENKWGRYAAFKDPSGIVHELMELFHNKS